jgi:hypothetical protein
MRVIARLQNYQIPKMQIPNPKNTNFNDGIWILEIGI